eukprot:3953941-Amphidinium_carterae.1
MQILADTDGLPVTRIVTRSCASWLHSLPAVGDGSKFNGVLLWDSCFSSTESELSCMLQQLLRVDEILHNISYQWQK